MVLEGVAVSPDRIALRDARDQRERPASINTRDRHSSWRERSEASDQHAWRERRETSDQQSWREQSEASDRHSRQVPSERAAGALEEAFSNPRPDGVVLAGSPGGTREARAMLVRP